MYVHNKKGVNMKKAKPELKMKPLPVRFDVDLVDRFKGICEKPPFHCKSQSEAARGAMKLGLEMMEKMTAEHVNQLAGDSHLHEDLLK